MPVLQIHYDKAIEGLGLTYDQFVDMCILCGCDYTPTVRGIGPKKAYNGIKAHHTAEKYLASLDKKKFPVRALPIRCRVAMPCGPFCSLPHGCVRLRWAAGPRGAHCQPGSGARAVQKPGRRSRQHV